MMTDPLADIPTLSGFQGSIRIFLAQRIHQQQRSVLATTESRRAFRISLSILRPASVIPRMWIWLSEVERSIVVTLQRIIPVDAHLDGLARLPPFCGLSHYANPQDYYRSDHNRRYWSIFTACRACHMRACAVRQRRVVSEGRMDG